jgi:aspartyl-tRNA(Asn)/glutamyl-tRNA(Gln) amidotransferase subunit C
MSEPTAALEAAASGTQKVTADEVLRVAELANLELTPSEVPRMQHDLNAILGYIAQLNELDTQDVPPMAQVGEMLGERLGGTPAATDGPDLRPDTVLPSIDRAAVMASAPETDGRFFKVPKVIER